MKKFTQIVLTLVACTFLVAPSCGQNGPTQPSVKLTWTQSTATGVTANCVYRGSATGTYTLPALFCSTAPITSYVDTTVQRGTTYHYGVTAQVGATESGYSNDAVAPVPNAPPPPTNNSPSQITKLEKPGAVPVLNAQVIWEKAPSVTGGK